ncbi:MAG: hypothetical protein AB7E51_17140 [Pseudodesulfovibrio sp.]|uniref:hypothetical protein n=1 Tax=Pseudodesulfovibrio sp. TaxID=2035812 RepID=UPI003D107D62
MKRLVLLTLIFVALAALAGCAAHGPLTETRDGNVLTFTRADTARSVTVTLAEDLKYDKRVHRDFMGAKIEGDLYRAPDNTSVLVSSLKRTVFEDLIGRELDGPALGVRIYPPQTSWLPRLCQLVRAYVVALDSDVVAVVKFGNYRGENGECAGDVTQEGFMAARFDEVAAFDKAADESIRITR